MRVSLSLVLWLTVLVIVTAHAFFIPRDGSATAEPHAAEEEGLEGQPPPRRENDHIPTHRRHHHHHHRHEHRNHEHLHHSGCPGCRQWQRLAGTSEEQLIQLRIEKIKLDLLNRLGLSAPPNVSVNGIPRNIPAPLQSYDDSDLDDRGPASLNDEDADELIVGHSKQIIVFAEEEGAFLLDNHGSTGRHSLHFVLPSGIPADTILSAELWLYKNTDSARANCSNTSTPTTVSVHSLLPTDDDEDAPSFFHRPSNRTESFHPLASQEVPPHADWFRMDFTDAVQSWIADLGISSRRSLEVEHSDCVSLDTRGIGRRPYLALGTRRGSGGARRRKRNAHRCHDGTQNCCRKHPLYINFHDIGWNFIHSPQGFHVNYCGGPCSVVPSFENLMGAQLRHTSLLQKISRINNNPDLLPCCSPTSLSNISLIYRDNQGNTIHENLDRIRVDACGCS